MGIDREHRVNRRIRAPSVRVIAEDGSQLGIMNLQDALALGQEREMDLVEVAPAADPPVCRLLDYGKFRYVQTKKEKEARKSQKSTGLREVRFRPGIGQHDLDAKYRIMQKLLAAGAKVKVSVLFRGRSITHPELGVVLLRKMAERLQGEAKLERAPAMEGRMLSIILAPMVRRDGGLSAPTVVEEQSKTSTLVAQGSENAETENT
ncbi:translation initiation factor IF-3 [Chloroflexota bacterium]